MGEGLGLRCRVQGPWGSQDPERSPERRGLCVCLPCEVPYQKKKRSKTLYGPEDGPPHFKSTSFSSVGVNKGKAVRL